MCFFMPDFQRVQCPKTWGKECLQRGNKESPIHGNNRYNNSISGNRQYRFSTLVSPLSMVIKLLLSLADTDNSVPGEVLQNSEAWLETMVGFSCYWPCEVCTSKFGNLLWFHKPFQSFACVTSFMHEPAYYPDWSHCVYEPWQVWCLSHWFFHRTPFL